MSKHHRTMLSKNFIHLQHQLDTILFNIQLKNESMFYSNYLIKFSPIIYYLWFINLLVEIFVDTKNLYPFSIEGDLLIKYVASVRKGPAFFQVPNFFQDPNSSEMTNILASRVPGSRGCDDGQIYPFESNPGIDHVGFSISFFWKMIRRLHIYYYYAFFCIACENTAFDHYSTTKKSS